MERKNVSIRTYKRKSQIWFGTEADSFSYDFVWNPIRRWDRGSLYLWCQRKSGNPYPCHWVCVDLWIWQHGPYRRDHGKWRGEKILYLWCPWKRDFHDRRGREHHLVCLYLKRAACKSDRCPWKWNGIPIWCLWPAHWDPPVWCRGKPEGRYRSIRYGCKTFGSRETEWKETVVPDHPLYQRPAGTGHRNCRCTGTEGNLHLW